VNTNQIRAIATIGAKEKLCAIDRHHSGMAPVGAGTSVTVRPLSTRYEPSVAMIG